MGAQHSVNEPQQWPPPLLGRDGSALPGAALEQPPGGGAEAQLLDLHRQQAAAAMQASMDACQSKHSRNSGTDTCMCYLRHGTACVFHACNRHYLCLYFPVLTGTYHALQQAAAQWPGMQLTPETLAQYQQAAGSLPLPPGSLAGGWPQEAQPARNARQLLPSHSLPSHAQLWQRQADLEPGYTSPPRSHHSQHQHQQQWSLSGMTEPGAQQSLLPQPQPLPQGGPWPELRQQAVAESRQMLQRQQQQQQLQQLQPEAAQQRQQEQAHVMLRLAADYAQQHQQQHQEMAAQGGRQGARQYGGVSLPLQHGGQQPQQQQGGSPAFPANQPQAPHWNQPQASQWQVWADTIKPEGEADGAPSAAPQVNTSDTKNCSLKMLLHTHILVCFLGAHSACCTY